MKGQSKGLCLPVGDLEPPMELLEQTDITLFDGGRPDAATEFATLFWHEGNALQVHLLASGLLVVEEA